MGDSEDRCPYCQGVDLTRLPESDVLPVNVYRCRGCGTQFNLDRVRDPDEPPLAITLTGTRVIEG